MGSSTLMPPAFPNAIHEEIKGINGKVLILAKDWFPPGVILPLYGNYFIVATFAAYSNGVDYRVEAKRTRAMLERREDADTLYSKESLPAKSSY